ncbi:helix-turn-helix domain-containing protein [Maribellus comscasis]|uniref:Helix-turn-helix domain-containing protein n=1 Tax=Maribellus comscasis TaxID=2681766 RepID=A0A6I6JIR3_9BACT|nr:Crp/Fnr family transcriptional regulator [Maribellus comscasis]QGY42161.1 helix-turn-helix domain-containing protein [Maribellus comscasis]
MKTENEIFAQLTSKLVSEIKNHGIKKEVPADLEVMREGQYIKAIPFVMNGLVKVYTRYDERELLLYYIKPGESCIMSFDACLQNKPSKVYASTEEQSTILLLPVGKVFRWMKEYPEMNTLFFLQYNTRYSELINMINQVLFEKLDKRLMEYLRAKVSLTNKNQINISHRKIANDLGTAREVVTRILKKMENENKISQDADGIKII